MRVVFLPAFQRGQSPFRNGQMQGGASARTCRGVLQYAPTKREERPRSDNAADGRCFATCIVPAGQLTFAPWRVQVHRRAPPYGPGTPISRTCPRF